MCDTFVAMSDVTTNESVIFGKNSDRAAGEVQKVEYFKEAVYEDNAFLECTYLKIPQAKHNFAVWLSKPHWIWGAEMGANERGVVIGNEAVWTNQTYKNEGLLGMDLVRLGLERGGNASEALMVITSCLEDHGQGGNGSEFGNMFYHNSFIIADYQEAWVLETAGQYWVAERVAQGVRSISNKLSIHGKGDLRHSEIIHYAENYGLCAGSDQFNFAEHFKMDEETLKALGLNFSAFQAREQWVAQRCISAQHEFSFDTATEILRDHDGGICMHGDGETRGSQISVLGKKQNQHWFIEGPFPCEQDYKEKRFY